jgi:hypothetical protein
MVVGSHPKTYTSESRPTVVAVILTINLLKELVLVVFQQDK